LFLVGHILFTSSETFAVRSTYHLATVAVRCIIQPLHTAKTPNPKNFSIWNLAMGSISMLGGGVV